MIQPDRLDPATMEYVAQLVEEGSLLDFVGISARTKRHRENAALCRKARIECREELASRIRALSGREDLSAVAVLRRISKAPENQHVTLLTDAWPLAWKGWLQIEAILVCNSNQIPPASNYRIQLTPKGLAVLAEQDAAETVAF